MTRTERFVISQDMCHNVDVPGFASETCESDLKPSLTHFQDDRHERKSVYAMKGCYEACLTSPCQAYYDISSGALC